jgi:hypothetical protein
MEFKPGVKDSRISLKKISNHKAQSAKCNAKRQFRTPDKKSQISNEK